MESNRGRREYFEQLAEQWDGFTDGGRVRSSLDRVLQPIVFDPAEHVLDVGCGTGNLTVVLVRLLGPEAVITAVDFARAMVDVARGKVTDARVRWLVADVQELPLEEGSVHRVICFSAWPHFPDPALAVRELRRVLRPGGMLHILHIDSRETINGIHSHVGGAIGHDLLPPVDDLACLLEESGFLIHERIDSVEAYRVTAERTA